MSLEDLRLLDISELSKEIVNSSQTLAYDKPVMLAGGLGDIYDSNIKKIQ